MRAEEKIVEGESKEREGLGAQDIQRGIGGARRRVKSDNGIQKSSFVRL